jgi:hypothetical protein
VVFFTVDGTPTPRAKGKGGSRIKSHTDIQIQRIAKSLLIAAAIEVSVALGVE